MRHLLPGCRHCAADHHLAVDLPKRPTGTAARFISGWYQHTSDHHDISSVNHMGSARVLGSRLVCKSAQSITWGQLGCWAVERPTISLGQSCVVAPHTPLLQGLILILHRTHALIVRCVTPMPLTPHSILPQPQLQRSRQHTTPGQQEQQQPAAAQQQVGTHCLTLPGSGPHPSPTAALVCHSLRSSSHTPSRHQDQQQQQR